jgi:nucleotide-binding universal stress UspA family protein
MLRDEREWPLTSKRFKSVVVALDGSNCSWCALDAALALCHEAGAQLTVLSLEGHLSVRSTLKLGFEKAERLRQHISAAALLEAEVFASYADVHVVAHRSVPPAWQVVAAYATEHQQDLIVLGRARGLFRGRLLPSTADRIAAHAHCPVMIVRPGEGSATVPISSL